LLKFVYKSKIQELIRIKVEARERIERQRITDDYMLNTYVHHYELALKATLCSLNCLATIYTN
jgi:hypothetical protein